MRLLFTQSDQFGSRFIRSVTGEEVSHVAIQLGRFVLHSTLDRGVHIVSIRRFLATREVIHSIKIDAKFNQILAILAKYEESPYDYGAFLYLGMRILLSKIGIEIPKANLWGTTGMFLCTEFVTQVLYGEELDYLTPGQLYRRLTSGS